MRNFNEMCLMIILKVTKKQVFTLYLENTVLKISQERVKLTPGLSMVNKYKDM